MKALLPLSSEVWEKANGGQAFTQFAEWTHRYRTAATLAERLALEEQGVRLARERLDALANLIEADPKQALETAVPLSVRLSLPQTVQDFLEEQVSGKGDLMVAAALPLPGNEREVQPISRLATVNSQTYDAYTFGWREEKKLSSFNVPIIGIAATSQAGKHVIAVSPQLVRLAEPEEVAASGLNPHEAICGISGQPADSRQQPTAVDAGGEIQFTCGVDHAILLNQRLIEAASGSSGTAGAAQPLASVNTYTMGRKRFLLLRPVFSDYANTMPTNTALTHFASFSNYMYQMSYGQLVFAALGQGSDVSKELLLPGVAATYDNTGLGLLFSTCKNVASSNGYNIAQYDFIYMVTAAEPAASYAGLGFIGGVGFHLANSYWSAGTASHEFGHNLGFNHANFWNTDSRSTAGFGQSIEYGDTTDPMGGASGLPEHYGSRYKNYISWIPDTDIATITTSGAYRLYSFDVADVRGGLRGLRFVRNSSQNYWVQFRQLYTSKGLANGVQLLWTGNGNEHSQLLDTRLKSDAEDNALVIGRTFSDTSLGLHITPIGKGHTYPESMDVVVNVGSFSGNLPPVASVGASATSVNTGQAITFNATASDPNGDTLAYYWDFDDGDFSIDNSPVSSHSFAGSGEYNVQCAVSDMKGGVARASMLVRVGNPTTFRISGHVFDRNGRPLAGGRVSVSSASSAISDSDGQYTIARLGAGSYPLDFNDPRIDNLAGLHPFFSNPITIGPNFTNADFVAGTPSSFYTVVVPKASGTWKYLDDGSNQGTAWTTNGFPDSSWKSGNGIFGYGENTAVTTTLSYGPDSNAKYVTTYFRRPANFFNPPIIAQLFLETLRQGGVIVYFNGTEVFRDNMPAGPVTSSTLGIKSLDAHTYRSITIPTNLLVAGTNMIAAELHLISPSAGATRFDLGLSAETVTTAARQGIVYLDQPANAQTFAGPDSLTLDAVASIASGPVTQVDFYADGIDIGTISAAPFSFSWSAPAIGDHTLTAVASGSSIQVTSAPVLVHVTAAAPPPVSLGLISTGAVWNYYFTNGPPAGSWALPGYNDSAWLAGSARLGFSSSNTGISTILYGGPGSARYSAAYFRGSFVIEDPASVTNLSVLLARDDGAVVYLNGIEILRDGVQNGITVFYSTLATNAADNGGTYFTYSIPPAFLTPGTNIIAVEVHQSSATSSDLIFDLGLSALAPSVRPRGCWLVAPADGTNVSSPGNVTLSAQVVAGGTLGVSKIEFFSDGAKIGQDISAPYNLVWANPPGGGHQLFAIATDSAGNTITSAPVSLNVTAPPVQSALVSFGDVWKYLDDGSNQGTNWIARNFDDHLWSSGPARLGYGGDGEITTIESGSDPNDRNVTAYFRKAFAVPSPAAFNGLLLRLVRDDGAMVYLNGFEIYRNNLLPGIISWNSLALTDIVPPGETTPLDANLSTAHLLAGTNVLAVELHQSSIASADAGFDLALAGLASTNLLQGVYVTSPADESQFNNPASVALSAYAVSSTPISLVEYFDGVMSIGQSAVSPYAVTWTGPSIGTHAITARATDASGAQMTSAVQTITIVPAPVHILPVDNTLIAAGSSWRYWDSASPVDANWRGTDFEDSSWPAGSARFGWGLDGEVTTLTSGRVSAYFRRWFSVPNTARLTELTFGLARDDGAVVYLNGIEVFRSNMPSGSISASTLASSTVNPPDETTYFQTVLPIPSAGLTLGSNLVAVELHQGSTNSSDAGFDLQLTGSGTSEGRVYLLNPTNGQNFAVPTNVTLGAAAWGGIGVVISKVDFYSDNTQICEAVTSPYQTAWTNPPIGVHSLLAVCTANNGLIVTSPPVTISVGYPVVSSLLIPTNSVWNYLDNGSNQGTSWAQRSYNDSTWSSGPAMLGYGDANGALPRTTLSYGPNANSKYITYYFRRWFSIPDTNAMVITNLAFRIQRDDGAVGYLNGVEIFRSNMPGVAINYLTLALSNVGTNDEVTFFPSTASASALVPGTNLLAVEIHQSAANSTDLAFDMELNGVGYSLPPVPPPVLSVQNLGIAVLLSWPSSAAGWNLYYTPDLSNTSGWSIVGMTPSDTNGIRSVSVAIAPAGAFFRLQKP